MSEQKHTTEPCHFDPPKDFSGESAVVSGAVIDTEGEYGIVIENRFDGITVQIDPDIRDRQCVFDLFKTLVEIKLQRDQLLAALKPIIERARYLDDSGPLDEGWQSEKLKAEIAEADAAIAAAEG